MTLVLPIGHSSLNKRHQFDVILTLPIKSRSTPSCRQEYSPFVHSQLNGVLHYFSTYGRHTFLSGETIVNSYNFMIPLPTNRTILVN